MNRFEMLLEMIRNGEELDCLGGRHNSAGLQYTTVVYRDLGSKCRQFVVDYNDATGGAWRIQRIGQRKVVHYA